MLDSPTSDQTSFVVRLGVLHQMDAERLQRRCVLRCFVTTDTMTLLCPFYEHCATRPARVALLISHESQSEERY